MYVFHIPTTLCDSCNCKDRISNLSPRHFESLNVLSLWLHYHKNLNFVNTGIHFSQVSMVDDLSFTKSSLSVGNWSAAIPPKLDGSAWLVVHYSTVLVWIQQNQYDSILLSTALIYMVIFLWTEPSWINKRHLTSIHKVIKSGCLLNGFVYERTTNARKSYAVKVWKILWR